MGADKKETYDDSRPVSQSEQSDTFKSSALTFFMVPFYFSSEWEDIHQYISRWELNKESLYDEDILYPYIMDLFRIKKGNETEQPSNRLQIYRLTTKNEGPNKGFWFDRVLGKKNVAILEKSLKEPVAINFRLSNTKNNAPHLFISSSAKIGIMTFCIELEQDSPITDLQNINYFLHKRNETNRVKVGEKKTQKGRTFELYENRTANYRCLCFSPYNKGSLSDDELMEKSSRFMKKDEYVKLTNDANICHDDFINWDINYFIDTLLNTIRGTSITYFNKDRIHLFSFCSVPGTLETGREIEKEEVYPDMLRLSRCVNEKYLLPFDLLQRDVAVLQTFDNILCSSAIEGTSMVCIARDINKGFMKSMPDKFNRQYLVVYLLVLLQRYTLLSIDRMLTEIDAQRHHVNKETEVNNKLNDDLWNLIDLTCKLKVNCYYTDVSVYTHHSQFYQHCCRSLNVLETFKEIGEKIELLKMTTDRAVQQIMDKQEKLQKEAARQQQEAMDRIKKKEKDDEMRHKEEIEEAEGRQRLLNFIVALLAIFELIQSAYGVIDHFGEKKMLVSLSIGIVCLIILLLLMRKDIKGMKKQLFNNSNQLS